MKSLEKKGATITLICFLFLVGLPGCIEVNEIKNQNPNVSINFPKDGDVISGIVNITGNAFDLDGVVKKVEISIYPVNSSEKHWDYIYDDYSNWSYVWNSKKVENGAYNISVRSFDGKNYSVVYTIAIVVENNPNHPPMADFIYTISDLTVYFIDKSSDADNDTLEYLWMFGDESNGADTTKQNPVHTYSASGTYTVTLVVCDGIDSDEKQVNITISVKTAINFSIASWNLQIFGQTKASNETLLNYYADKPDDYDLFVIQEIRDKSGTSIVKLAEKLPAYNYIISERAGRTSSKEQYAIFYNNRATLINQHDWTPEKQNKFERPPLEATFTVANWTFTIYTIHTKPDDVYNEFTNLENLIGEPEEDIIILGDLNADGSYYDEDNIAHFTDWNWIITNDVDTTVAISNNTYDRIIISDAAMNNYISKGVMNDVTKDESDHYLVYAVFDPSMP